MTLKQEVENILAGLGFGRQTPPAPPTPEPQAELQSSVQQDERLSALEQEKAQLAKELADERAALAKTQEELAKATGESAEAVALAKQERINASLSALVASFRITPATQEAFSKIAQSHPEAVELCLPALESLERLSQIGGGVDGGDARAAAENVGGDFDADKLVNLAKAYAKENGVSLSSAMTAVARQNPELARSVAAPKTSGVIDTEG